MRHRKGLSDPIRVGDRISARLDGRTGSGSGRGAPPIKPWNVDITLRDKPNGRVVERRRGHNIFLNYGREWLAELTSLDVGGVPFRDDRVKYMAFGIGGASQLLTVSTIQSLYTGWSGYTTPTQDDTDPEVTGLEYPVEVALNDYYDTISQPATFPEAGIVRYTAVAGYYEISYSGGPTSVPLSEIGLFTELVTDQSVSPTSAPPERYMVAYNTFDTLSKTSAYVLQVDWELRYS